MHNRKLTNINRLDFSLNFLEEFLAFFKWSTYDYVSGHYYLKNQGAGIYDYGEITDGITKTIPVYSPGLFFISRNVTVTTTGKDGSAVVIHPDNTFTLIAIGGSTNCSKGDIVLANEITVKITYR